MVPNNLVVQQIACPLDFLIYSNSKDVVFQCPTTFNCYKENEGGFDKFYGYDLKGWKSNIKSYHTNWWRFFPIQWQQGVKLRINGLNLDVNLDEKCITEPTFGPGKDSLYIKLKCKHSTTLLKIRREFQKKEIYNG